MVWTTLVGALRSSEGCALKLEGIFRISGETTAVNTLGQRLDNEVWTLEVTDSHVVAHALKRWIGGLASPLVPRNVHVAILEAMRKGDPDDVLVPKLHHLLHVLPPYAGCVFMDLLQLMSETLVHRATNLMTETSLATIFSPLVLQSQKDLTAFMQNMELERRWMELLILNPPNPSCLASTTPSSVVLTQNIVPFPDAVTLAVVGDVLIAASKETVSALNLTTLDLRFRVKIVSKSPPGSPSWMMECFPPLVFLGNQQSLHAIDVLQGKEIWHYEVPLSAGGPCHSLAVLRKGLDRSLLILMVGASIFGFDPQNGVRTLSGCNASFRTDAPVNAWQGELGQTMHADRNAPLVLPIEGFGWDCGRIDVPTVHVALQSGLILQEEYAPHYQQVFSKVHHTHYLGCAAQEHFVVTVEVANASNCSRPLMALITSHRGSFLRPLDLETHREPSSVATRPTTSRRLGSSIPTSSSSVSSGGAGAHLQRKPSGGVDPARLLARKRSGSMTTPEANLMNGPPPPETLCQCLETQFRGCTLTRIDPNKCLIVDVMISRALLEMENSKQDSCRSVAVLFWRSGQSMSQALANQATGEFDAFLATFGERVRLKGWEKFAGSLDVTNDTHGAFSVYNELAGFQVMAHIPAMLPASADDAQRKTLIAGDRVLIIFWEGSGSFDPSEFVSDQSGFVFIVVEQLVSESPPPLRYRIAVVCSQGVMLFEPHVPSGAILEAGVDLRKWLVMKVLNGQRAVLGLPQFQEAATRLRRLRLGQLVQQAKQHVPPDAVRLNAPFDPAVLPVSGSLVKCRALSSVSAATTPSYLPFGKGDVIVVYHKISDEVWNGGLGHQRGDFLAQHVALVVEEVARTNTDDSKATVSETFKGPFAKKSGSMIERKRIPRPRSESIPWATSSSAVSVGSVPPPAPPSPSTKKPLQIIIETLMENPPVLIPDTRWMKWTSISFAYDWSRLNVVQGYHYDLPQQNAQELLANNRFFVEPQNRTPFYQQCFLQRPHALFVGVSKTGERFVIATELASEENRGVPILALLFTKASTARAVVNLERSSLPSPIADLPPLLDSLFPGCSLKRLESGSAHDILSERLIEFENMHLDFNRRVGVLYWKSGQTENEAFGNQLSDSLDAFLNFFGERVRLKGWTKFRGGLNVVNDETGEYSVYAEFREFAFMTHVSALLPYNPNDEQKLDRKRHIGNDLVVIIFWEGEGSFNPSKLVTQMCHVFIVVEPIGGQYRVHVVCKSGVPPFPPHLPSPPLFDSDDYFRQWLFMKIINGERAAFQTKVFLSKTSNARGILLDKMAADALAVPPQNLSASLSAPWKFARFVIQEPAIKYKAIQTFESPSPLHLHFRKGEEVLVFCKMSDDWWNGSVANRRGDFPALCVEEKGKGSRIASRNSSAQQDAIQKQRPSFSSSSLLQPTCEVSISIVGASNLVLPTACCGALEVHLHVATPTGLVLPGSQKKTPTVDLCANPIWNDLHSFELVDPLWETFHAAIYSGDALLSRTSINCEQLIIDGSASTLHLPLRINDNDQESSGAISIKVLRAMVIIQAVDSDPEMSPSASPASSPAIARKRGFRNRSISQVE